MSCVDDSRLIWLWIRPNSGSGFAGYGLALVGEPNPCFGHREVKCLTGRSLGRLGRPQAFCRGALDPGLPNPWATLPADFDVATRNAGPELPLIFLRTTGFLARTVDKRTPH